MCPSTTVTETFEGHEPIDQEAASTPQPGSGVMAQIGSELGRAGRALRSVVRAPAKVTWRAVARQRFWSAVIWPFGGVRVEGSFEDAGPYVVLANHGSHADTIAMVSASPTIMRVVTVAAQDYWFTRGSRRLIARGLLGAYPVRRDGQGAYEELRGSLANRVAESMSVLIFPEGARTTDGSLASFHTGAARLARDFGVPLLPVALVGSRELLPKKRGLPRYSPVEVRVGTPVPPTDDVATATQQAHDQVTAVAAGSVTGVAVGHLLAARGTRLPAPWTTPAMRRAVRRHLAAGPTATGPRL